MSRIQRTAIVLALGCLVLFWTTTFAAEKATIVFKDGYSLRGRVVQQRDVFFDPASGRAFSIPLPSGFFFIDDDVRRIIFSPRRVHEVIKDEPGQFKPGMALTKTGTRLIGNPLMVGWEMEKVGAWQENWERSIRFLTNTNRRLNVEQRITVLTPRYMRVDALKYNWIPRYFTDEIGPKKARKLVLAYFKNKTDMKEVDKRLKVFHFFYQARWLDLALAELAEIVKEFPDSESTVAPLRQKVREEQANMFVDRLSRMSEHGQHDQVISQLEAFYKSNFKPLLADTHVLKAQALKSKYRRDSEKLEEAQHLLQEIPKHVTEAEQDLFSAAAKAILGELSYDNVDRLLFFTVYGKQFERELKEKTKLSQSAEEVLAMAITGWLQGSNAAQPKVDIAKNLWKTRTEILRYLTTDNVGQRRVQMEVFNKFAEKNNITPSIIARMIQFLPPADPYEETDSKVLELKIQVPGSQKGEDYYVWLPPGYSHGRPRPLLMLLHSQRDDPKKMIMRFAPLAARHGYVLAAPVWGGGGFLRDSYRYTSAEHDIVIDCLRDIRRRFRVDSDHTFLFGWEEGGTMAYDIGLSHPHEFAGILPMNGNAVLFPSRYWSNGQYLPFYVVDGSHNGTHWKVNRELFKEWIRWGYPMLYCEYKGRSSEWYSAELPKMFDWMSHQKRAHPTRQLGTYGRGSARGEEFKTMRQGDDTFYFVSLEEISPRRLNSFRGWRNRVLPATVQARIVTGNELVTKKTGAAQRARIWNQINVRSSGVRYVTVWLGPKMIDFDKDVSIRLNSRYYGRTTKIEPSIETLLEHYYINGDRERLFFAKVTLKAY